MFSANGLMRRTEGSVGDVGVMESEQRIRRARAEGDDGGIPRR